MSQRTSSARLFYELELDRLACEPQQQKQYINIYSNIISWLVNKSNWDASLAYKKIEASQACKLVVLPNFFYKVRL
jgi:hypothetical protein